MHPRKTSMGHCFVRRPLRPHSKCTMASNTGKATTARTKIASVTACCPLIDLIIASCVENMKMPRMSERMPIRLLRFEGFDMGLGLIELEGKAMWKVGVSGVTFLTPDGHA